MSDIKLAGQRDIETITELRIEVANLKEKNEQLRLRLLSAAGDDLCRLSQDEIKKYTSGEVQIPPKEEFIPSCKRFWEQTAVKSGVLKACLTLAQLISENEKLRRENDAMRSRNKQSALQQAGDRRDWDECNRLEGLPE